MSRTTVRTAGALVASAALTLSTLALAGVPAQAAPAKQTETNADATKAGASWLVDELDGGLLHNEVYDFDDYGLSVDAALALDAVGGNKKSVRTIARAVAKNVESYLGTPDTYAGSVAKSLVLAQVADQDPTAFGGVDLVERLEGRVTASGVATGRIVDESTYGDYANTIGQAYAVRGLAAADSSKASDATAFLLQQQCKGGYFRLYFSEATAPVQSCTTGAEGSEADVDATAIAVLNLIASDQDTKSVKRSVKKSVKWLSSQQKGNGAFGGGTSTSRPNTNSTGLAGWALALSGNEKAASKAATWVRSLQPADLGACRTKLKREAGAIAYDRKALKLGRVEGLTGDAQDQWRRATTQALPILQWAPTSDTALKAQAGRMHGNKQAFRISGLAKGEWACIQIKKGASAAVKGKSKPIVVGLKTPSSKGSYPVKVKTLTSTAKSRLQVRG